MKQKRRWTDDTLQNPDADHYLQNNEPFDPDDKKFEKLECLQQYFSQPQEKIQPYIRFVGNLEESDPVFIFSQTLSLQTLFESPIQENSNKEIVQTNLMKNFIRSYVKFFRTDKKAKQKFKQINEIPETQKEHKYRKLVERLQKKLKKDGKMYTCQDLLNMLSYSDKKDQVLTKYLFNMCYYFLEQYPLIVKNSNRIENKDDNIRIITVIRNFLMKSDIN